MPSSPSARATSAGLAMNLWFCWERSIRRLMRISDPRIVVKLAEIHVDLQHGATLAGLTSLGIGGPTDLLPLNKHESPPDPPKLLGAKHGPDQFLPAGAKLPLVVGEPPAGILPPGPRGPAVT